ncbi:MAG: ATP synthase F1 subunit epsilon [bacterium]|nr:ATP synthase F1 subunit epsilon [bacterium]
MSLTLEVITPKRVLLSAEAVEVTLPGEVGELGILAGHIPVLTALKSGVLAYGQGKDKKLVAVHHGFAEVHEDRVTVLAKDADLAEEIDLATTQAQLAQLNEQLKTVEKNSTEEAALTKELTLAQTRLLVAEGSKGQHH